MTYDVDGWMNGRNPSNGGGFTICRADGSLVKRIAFNKIGWTNNDAELWAVAAAVHLAKTGDIIRSDSEVMVKWWVPRGMCKSRPDLNTLCKLAHDGIRDKRLTLTWIPRAQNLAGIYNDTHKGL
jgi:ribonuclease HI